MKPIEQIALKLAAKLGWVPGHDDLADEVIGNIAAALRARDQEWREAVEGVAKEIDNLPHSYESAEAVDAINECARVVRTELLSRPRDYAAAAAKRIATHYAANDMERHAAALVPIIQSAIDAATAELKAELDAAKTRKPERRNV